MRPLWKGWSTPQRSPNPQAGNHCFRDRVRMAQSMREGMPRFYPRSERRRYKNKKGNIAPRCLRPQTGIAGNTILPLSLARLKASLSACLPRSGPLARRLIWTYKNRWVCSQTRKSVLSTPSFPLTNFIPTLTIFPCLPKHIALPEVTIWVWLNLVLAFVLFCFF